MKVLSFLIIAFFTHSALFSQKVNYIYDKVGRLTKAIYPDQKAINYYYDKDGNRTSQVISTIITNVSNLNDSLLTNQNNVYIYPNPSSGIFRVKFYSEKRQEVSIQIISIDGSFIHIYKAISNKGFYEFNININPHPSGMYIVKMIAETFTESKTVIIIK